MSFPAPASVKANRIGTTGKTIRHKSSDYFGASRGADTAFVSWTYFQFFFSSRIKADKRVHDSAPARNLSNPYLLSMFLKNAPLAGPHLLLLPGLIAGHI
jgi:hypothetical protein